MAALRQRQEALILERTKTEARSVLRAVISDLEVKPARCQHGAEWSSRPVTGDVARRYLGSPLYADVIASHTGLSPSAVVDPRNTVPDNFCRKDEAEAHWRQMQDDFRSGMDPGAPDIYDGKPNGPPRIRFNFLTMTIPVFNPSLTRAAVIVSFEHRQLSRVDAEQARLRPQNFDEAGYLRRASLELAGYTYVYRKRKGRWARVYRNQDYAGH